MHQAPINEIMRLGPALAWQGEVVSSLCNASLATLSKAMTDGHRPNVDFLPPELAGVE